MSENHSSFFEGEGFLPQCLLDSGGFIRSATLQFEDLLLPNVYMPTLFIGRLVKSESTLTIRRAIERLQGTESIIPLYIEWIDKIVDADAIIQLDWSIRKTESPELFLLLGRYSSTRLRPLPICQLVIHELVDWKYKEMTVGEKRW